MKTEQFNLNINWDDFESCAANSFKELLGETDFADVTLVSDDLQRVEVHKVILGASSSKFKTILQQTRKQEPLIYLSGVSYKEMRSLIDFMYLGQTEVGQDDLEHFLEISAKFDVKGLSDYNLPKNQSQEKDHIEIESDTNIIIDQFKPVIMNEQFQSELSNNQIESEIEDDNFGNELMNKQFENEVWNKRSEPDAEQENGIFEPQIEVDASEKEMNLTICKIGKMFYCDGCDYKTDRSYSLKLHRKARHEGAKLTCDQCNAQYSFPHALIKHKKTKHSYPVGSIETVPKHP